MKKTLSAVLLTAFSVLCLCAGEQLWDGSLDTVKLTSGNKLKDVSVKTEDGVLDVSATSEGPSVTYVSVEIRVKPFKLAGKSLAFDVWSDQPKTTDAFYVRLQDAKRRNILSFQQWNTPLKAQPENRFVQPGFSNRLMRWEATEIKADENTDADRIVFFIGSRGDGKKMSLKIRNIELADAAALPEKPAGKAVPSNGVGCVSAAALDNGVLTVKTLVVDPGIIYTFTTIPFSGSLAGKKLVLTAGVDVPNVVGAFYVRGYNAKKQCILSYKSWTKELKTEPRTFTFTPGQNSSGLGWEADRVTKDADQQLASLEIITGCSKQYKKQFTLTVRDIRLE